MCPTRAVHRTIRAAKQSELGRVRDAIEGAREEALGAGASAAVPAAVRLPGLIAYEQRIADAVAVAGIRAAGHGSPRVVVLVLSAQVDDDSVYPVPAVKHFLAEIGVPIVVWVTPQPMTMYPSSSTMLPRPPILEASTMASKGRRKPRLASTSSSVPPPTTRAWPS